MATAERRGQGGWLGRGGSSEAGSLSGQNSKAETTGSLCEGRLSRPSGLGVPSAVLGTAGCLRHPREMSSGSQEQGPSQQHVTGIVGMAVTG